MKALFTSITLAIGFAAYSAAICSILPNGNITFYNFGVGSYDLSGDQVTIDGQDYEVSTATVISGNLNMAATGTVEINFGVSFKTSGGPHSVALWGPGTFPDNVLAFNMLNYVQWGASGQAFESQADSVGLWTAGTFVNGEPPLQRDTDFSTWGASHWSASTGVEPVSPDQIMALGSNPFRSELVITLNSTVDVFVTTVLGETILQERFVEGEHRISASAWNSGVILIAIRDEQGLRKAVRALHLR